MTSSKSIPLTKNEVMHLLELIMSHPVVYSKGTNAANNLLKDRAWREITDVFNASIANVPRKPETLRLKWENLKKTARKRTSKTSETPDYYQLDGVLDRVTAILERTVPSLPASSSPAGSLSPGASPPGSSQKYSTKKLFQSPTNKGKLKRLAIDAVKTSLKRKNEAIAEYYEAKRKQEAEIFQLNKRKLELEIRELEDKLNI